MLHEFQESVFALIELAALAIEILAVAIITFSVIWGMFQYL